MPTPPPPQRNLFSSFPVTKKRATCQNYIIVYPRHLNSHLLLCIERNLKKTKVSFSNNSICTHMWNAKLNIKNGNKVKSDEGGKRMENRKGKRRRNTYNFLRFLVAVSCSINAVPLNIVCSTMQVSLFQSLPKQYNFLLHEKIVWLKSVSVPKYDDDGGVVLMTLFPQVKVFSMLYFQQT